MSDVIIVGILLMLGTLGGSMFGVMKANKLVTFRLEQLEKKVDKHNCLVERMKRCYGNRGCYNEDLKRFAY